MKKFAFIILAPLTALSIQAQDLYNNGSIISIKSNTVFSTGQGFTNNGVVTNNGSLMVGGVWMNTGTYNEANGDVTFSSSEAQVINHNSQSFTKLHVTGGGIKTFEADLTIKEELVLTDGVLQAFNDAKLIIAKDATINGGFDNSYVEGTIVHQGTGNKLFPLGRSNAYLPIELVDVSGVEPEIAFSVIEPNPNSSFDGSLNGVSINQYWNMELISGSFDGSLIKLGINNENFVSEIESAVVVQASSLESSFTSLGQSESNGDIISGSVTSDEIGVGPIFTVGSTPIISPETSITVINALSPNGDGIHDFLKIMNIGAFPDNTLTIFNRWGDRVFEVKDYDNVNNVFEGFNNVNGSDELLDGTYYYVVDKNDGGKTESGFIEIRR